MSYLTKHASCSKFEKKTKIDTFKTFAERWKEFDYEYNIFFDFVSWNDNPKDKKQQKLCKGTSFKEAYLFSQGILTTMSSNSDETSIIQR